MALMDRKIFREIYRSKFRSLLIILIVAVTVGMITGMRGGHPMVQATYKDNLISNNVADGRFTFPTPFDQNNISAIATDTAFMQNNRIESIEGRLFYYTDLKYEGGTFPAVVIGIEYPNTVNKLGFIDMASDITNETQILDGTHNAILDPYFGGSLFGQDIAFNENLTVLLGAVDVDFTIKASAQDVDHLYVVDPITKMTAMGQLCVMWVDIDVMQNHLFGGAPKVNQILYTVEERLDRSLTFTAYDGLVEKFNHNGMETSGFDFQIYDETDDYTFFDADAGSIDKVGVLFGLIGLVVCAVAIFNTITHMINSQRRNIGLFMSLGAKPRKIILHYVKVTAFLSTFGIILGIPMGYGLAVGMTKFIVRFMGFAKLSIPLITSEFIIGGGITFVVCVVLSALSAFPITQISPRAAMTAFYNRITVTKEKFFEKLFGWMPGFRALHMKIPLREIFFRKKKSAFTVLAITTSMIVLINSLSMVTNMYTAINRNYTDYNTSDVQVTLTAPMNISEINTKMSNLPDGRINKFEIYLSLPTKLSHDGEIKSGILLECYSQSTEFRNLNIIEGDITNFQDITNTSIILGNSLAGKYGIALNDQVEIGLLGNYSVEVGALVGELIDFNAFWSLEAFFTGNISDYFGIQHNFVNGIMIDVAEGIDPNVLRSEMSEEFSIGSWIDAEQSKQSVMTLMQSMMGILGLFILIGVGIGIIFSFNTMYFGFISRENDFLSLKAMGAQKKYLRSIIFRENALLSFFSLILTVPIGYAVYWWSMDYMLEDRMYMPLSIPLYTWPAVFLLSLVSIWLATRRMMKKIDKMVLSDELRIRIVS